MAKVRLLLAAKSEIFREGLAKLLECQSDIKVVCVCHSGLEIVKSAQKYQANIILIDTELPDCNSIEAMQCISKRLPETSIIVLTESVTNTVFLSAINAGARAYLSKDLSLENLSKAIILVSMGGMVISSPIAEGILTELKSLSNRKDAAKSSNFTLLSKREQAILSLVEQGLTNREIAAILFISEHTVKVHLRNAMGKLHAHTRQQAVVLAKKDRYLGQVKTGNKDVDALICSSQDII